MIYECWRRPGECTIFPIDKNYCAHHRLLWWDKEISNPYWDLIAIIQFDTYDDCRKWWRHIHDANEVQQMQIICRMLRR